MSRRGSTPTSPPQTWDEFLAAAKALTKDGVYGTAWLGVQGDASTWAWATYLFSEGGTFFDENDKPVFNSEAGVKALQMIVDMIHKDQVMPPSVSSWDYDQINAAFPQGRVAMVINWPYMLSLANDPAQSAVAGKVKIALGAQGNGLRRTRRRLEVADRQGVQAPGGGAQVYRVRHLG